jgi:hypothetical protein
MGDKLLLPKDGKTLTNVRLRWKLNLKHKNIYE